MPARSIASATATRGRRRGNCAGEDVVRRRGRSLARFAGEGGVRGTSATRESLPPAASRRPLPQAGRGHGARPCLQRVHARLDRSCCSHRCSPHPPPRSRVQEKLAPCLACHGESGQSQTGRRALARRPAGVLPAGAAPHVPRAHARDRADDARCCKDASDADLRAMADAHRQAAAAASPTRRPADPGRTERAPALIQRNRCNFCHNCRISPASRTCRGIAGQREDYLRQGAARLQGQQPPRLRHPDGGRGRAADRRRLRRPRALSCARACK